MTKLSKCYYVSLALMGLGYVIATGVCALNIMGA